MSQVNTADALQYAQAIYASALEDWQRDLLVVVERLNSSTGLVEQLDNVDQSFQARQKILDDILSPDLPQKTRNFLYTLVENGHVHVLENVTLNLSRLATQGPNLEVAIVTTAITLDEADKDQFRTRLRAKHGDNLELDFQIDEDILGGAIVQVGDKIIDGSVSRKLNVVRENLVRG